MSQTLMSDRDRTRHPRRSQGLWLVAVAAASSLLTAAVMGDGRAERDSPQRTAARTADASTPMPLGTTLPDTGSSSATADFPVQEPAPTF